MNDKNYRLVFVLDVFYVKYDWFYIPL